MIVLIVRIYTLILKMRKARRKKNPKSLLWEQYIGGTDVTTSTGGGKGT